MRTKNGNEIERVDTQDRLLEVWPFFLEGLESLNDSRRANMEETPEKFFKMVSRIVGLSKKVTAGAVVVVKSKGGKLLGFGSGFDATGLFPTHRILFIYAVYSNGKNAKAVEDLMNWCEDYAKEAGFQELQAATGRFSGAAFRWFEGKFGFRRKSLVFRKKV